MSLRAPEPAALSSTFDGRRRFASLRWVDALVDGSPSAKLPTDSSSLSLFDGKSCMLYPGDGPPDEVDEVDEVKLGEREWRVRFKDDLAGIYAEEGCVVGVEESLFAGEEGPPGLVPKPVGRPL